MNLGSERDWLDVMVLAVFWALSMSAAAYIRRRRRNGRAFSELPLHSRVGVLLSLAFVSFDFGFLTTFWTRSFHGTFLLILIAVNVALIGTVFGLRLLRPLNTA
ncbi:MAG: hypothetical protein WBS18_12875 [Candidatus Acidiferrales bacterium]